MARSLGAHLPRQDLRYQRPARTRGQRIHPGPAHPRQHPGRSGRSRERSKWLEVWAHIYLGKIFDISGQRERAVNEYTQAQRTRDNTQGAQDEVAKDLRTPYKTASKERI